jgi:hypothetical protein
MGTYIKNLKLVDCVDHLFDDDVDRVALLRRRRAGVRPGVVDPGMIDRKPELKLSIATGISRPALKQNLFLGNYDNCCFYLVDKSKASKVLIDCFNKNEEFFVNKSSYELIYKIKF